MFNGTIYYVLYLQILHFYFVVQYNNYKNAYINGNNMSNSNHPKILFNIEKYSSSY